MQICGSQTVVPSQMCCIIYCLPSKHRDQRLCHNVALLLPWKQLER